MLWRTENIHPPPTLRSGANSRTWSLHGAGYRGQAETGAEPSAPAFEEEEGRCSSQVWMLGRSLLCRRRIWSCLQYLCRWRETNNEDLIQTDGGHGGGSLAGVEPARAVPRRVPGPHTDGIHHPHSNSQWRTLQNVHQENGGAETPEGLPPAPTTGRGPRTAAGCRKSWPTSLEFWRKHFQQHHRGEENGSPAVHEGSAIIHRRHPTGNIYK